MAAMRLASYNVHRAIGRDRRTDPERILGVIREMDADVVALQEVEAHDTGGDMLAWLARETGMHAVAGTTLARRDGHYGNGLLSRFDIKGTELVDLSFRTASRAARSSPISMWAATGRCAWWPRTWGCGPPNGASRSSAW
jgi:endonuclease/exonuclease/phosphatase family metal-dependent hydrolase